MGQKPRFDHGKTLSHMRQSFAKRPVGKGLMVSDFEQAMGMGAGGDSRPSYALMPPLVLNPNPWNGFGKGMEAKE